MTDLKGREAGFRATTIVDYQLFVTTEPPEVPSSYDLTKMDGVWVAHDRRLPTTKLLDQSRRPFATVFGFAYSEFTSAFLPAGEAELPLEITDIQDIEEKVLPLLSGMFVLLTAEGLPRRIYPDHGGSLPIVFSASDRRAASSPSLLLDETDYRDRFRADLHKALVGREGYGGWISGTLTAHEDVSRLLPNHCLDLSSWTAHRFWPRPGEFSAWRNIDEASSRAAMALRGFSTATCREFNVAATLTAGFDSRLVLASCRESVSRCKFVTIEAPNAEMDIEISRRLARQFGLSHSVLPLKEADNRQMALWDRAVGDCVREQPRRTHPTLRDLTDSDAMFTGMYGEVGRCRLYRQDLLSINQAKIDARFVLDRLTLPAQSDLLENIELWFSGVADQPNSVILDLAFLELKFGSWAMGQRPMTNSIKLNFLPFAQRAVFDAFIGVAPAEKGTGALFRSIIDRLWPELGGAPINKYGDIRDHLTIWKKASDPTRVRRFLRDRLARKDPAGSGGRGHS
ncbi:hypothetical protein [Phenylobacterium koreense]|uniref:Asparagine synthetase domain-containing protein n=1 Tax=Phenylobacterium koreense TaxID=266125 RepID=A0ABV2EM53_9CAUL